MGTGRWPPYNEGMGHCWDCPVEMQMEARGQLFSASPPPVGTWSTPSTRVARYSTRGTMLFSHSPAPLRARVASHRCQSSDGATG